MRKDHDRGDKGGGRRRTEATNKLLCKKSAKELVHLNGKIRSPQPKTSSFHVLVSQRFYRTRLCSERFWRELIISFKSREPAASKTNRPENGHFDVLMTFSFLLPTQTKLPFTRENALKSKNKQVCGNALALYGSYQLCSWVPGRLSSIDSKVSVTISQ